MKKLCLPILIIFTCCLSACAPSDNDSDISNHTTEIEVTENKTSIYEYHYNSSESESNKTNYNYSYNHDNDYDDSYDSYDSGYEDVIENEEVDYDRYYSDPDYADGVDEASDEYGLDW